MYICCSDKIDELKCKIPGNPSDLEILKIIATQNRVNYNNLKINITRKSEDGEYDITVIFPVRGRRENLEFVIPNFLKSISVSVLKVSIVVVEYDEIPHYESLCNFHNINYVYVDSRFSFQFFNKCLCYNIGALYFSNTKYYLFHDVDCPVKKDFFSWLETILARNIINFQPYPRKRIIHVFEELSNKVRSGDIGIDDIDEATSGVYIPLSGSKGGSILVKKESFFNCGGYDPEFFWNYSPEDNFFFEKIGFMEYCSDDGPEMFHLYHQPITGRILENNPHFYTMCIIHKIFSNLPEEQKQDFLGWKRNLLEKVK